MITKRYSIAKYLAALSVVGILSACNTTTIDQLAQDITSNTNGLVNVMTPGTLKARKEAMLIEALNTGKDQNWQSRSQTCRGVLSSTNCYIKVDVYNQWDGTRRVIYVYALFPQGYESDSFAFQKVNGKWQLQN